MKFLPSKNLFFVLGWNCKLEDVIQLIENGAEVYSVNLWVGDHFKIQHRHECAWFYRNLLCKFSRQTNSICIQVTMRRKPKFDNNSISLRIYNNRRRYHPLFDIIRLILFAHFTRRSGDECLVNCKQVERISSSIRHKWIYYNINSCLSYLCRLEKMRTSNLCLRLKVS